MGSAVAITRTDFSAAELRQFAGKCQDAAQVRRILAIALVLEGVSRTEAAARNGMDRQTLPDWVHHYNTNGIDGLQSRQSSGRTPALTTDQMAELKALVLKGPDLLEHKVVRWRRQDLQGEVARRFNLHVHESTIGKQLHQLGLKRLQPRPFHPRKSAEAEELFKKLRRHPEGDLASLHGSNTGRNLVPR
jgi:transposase